MRAAVIGGGIAGLTAAWELTARDGIEVALFEAGDRFGGKLRAGELGGHSVDVGAESFLARRPEVPDLLRQFGAGSREVSADERGAWIWRDGRLHAMPAGGVMGFPRSYRQIEGLLTPMERARLRLDSLLPKTDVEPDIAVGAYARARFGAAFVDAVVQPFLGGVYAGSADELSMRVTVPTLWEQARKHRAAAAAARAVHSGGTGPVFGSLAPGLHALPGLLADALRDRGASTRIDSPVREIFVHDGGWRVSTDAVAMDVDVVILAVPSLEASSLLTSSAPDMAERLAALGASSVAIATFALSASEVPAGAFPGTGFLAAAPNDLFIKAATWSSRKWPHLASAAPDTVFVRASVGGSSDEAWRELDDATILSRAWADVARVSGLSASPVASRVDRWERGLPRYAPGHTEVIEAVRAGLPAGLALAGAAYDGVGLPAVIGSGRAAVGSLLRAGGSSLS